MNFSAFIRISILWTAFFSPYSAALADCVDLSGIYRFDGDSGITTIGEFKQTSCAQIDLVRTNQFSDGAIDVDHQVWLTNSVCSSLPYDPENPDRFCQRFYFQGLELFQDLVDQGNPRTENPTLSVRIIYSLNENSDLVTTGITYNQKGQIIEQVTAVAVRQK